MPGLNIGASGLGGGQMHVQVQQNNQKNNANIQRYNSQSQIKSRNPNISQGQEQSEQGAALLHNPGYRSQVMDGSHKQQMFFGN